VPTAELTKENVNRLMLWHRNETYRVSLGGGRSFETTYEGVVPNLERPTAKPTVISSVGILRVYAGKTLLCL